MSAVLDSSVPFIIPLYPSSVSSGAQVVVAMAVI
jgi:hypothetical protein